MGWIGSDDNRTRFLNWVRRVGRYSLLAMALGIAVMLLSTYYGRFNQMQQFYCFGYLKATFFSTVLEGYNTSSEYLSYEHKRSKDGQRDLGFLSVILPDKQAYQFLHDEIFEHQSLWEWNQLPGLVLGLVTLIGVLGFTLRRDYRGQKEQEKGRILRGPILVNPQEFNKLWLRKERAEAKLLARKEASKQKIELPLKQRIQAQVLIKLGLKEPPEVGFTYQVWDSKKRVVKLALPAKTEVEHFAILGATGSGKSTFLKQTLAQLEVRGEQAIIYDPVGEMAELFYRPERGDQILNPLDARCPYIDISSEIVAQEEAANLAERTDLAQGMFPDSIANGSSGMFFIQAARKIFAFLLKQKVSQTEMIKLISSSESILKLAANDPEAQEVMGLLDPDARGQHGAIMGTLALVPDALRLLPKEGKEKFSFWKWAKNRGPGWLFITGAQNSRAALRPLQSLFFHLLIRRCFNIKESLRPVMFILDELQTLEKLMVLEECLTEGRKYNCKFLFGCQDKSQLDERYKLLANTLLSQSSSKIFLRASEVNTAKWISQTIGEVEIERVSASHTATPAREHSLNYSLQRQIQPLVLGSEITNLASLEGYVKYGEWVVEMKLKPQDYPKIAQGFIARQALPSELPVSIAPAVTEADKPQPPSTVQAKSLPSATISTTNQPKPVVSKNNGQISNNGVANQQVKLVAKGEPEAKKEVKAMPKMPSELLPNSKAAPLILANKEIKPTVQPEPQSKKEATKPPKDIDIIY